jgi:hypothetical protein
MLRTAGGLFLLIFATGAAAADTDWGIRELGKPPKSSAPAKADLAKKGMEPPPAGTWALDSGSSTGSSSVSSASSSGRAVEMGNVKQIGSNWGRVTSTYRSPEHNRRVGGVANSYHLRNRAIDIARRPGVSHSQIAAAYRNAGYSLAESLDEGDHSHFAFGTPKFRGPRPQMVSVQNGEKTEWRIVYAPPSSSGGGN